MGSIEQKYAQLLVDYSLYLKKGEKLFIRTSFLAAPLVKEIYRLAVARGVIVELEFEMEGQNKILLEHATEDVLDYTSLAYSKAMTEFDAYLYIRAPYNLGSKVNTSADRSKRRRAALSSYNQSYFQRTADGSMKRTLCQYPTLASAQVAGMSLEEYRDFVFSACKLDTQDATEAWLEVRAQQQKIKDYLDQVDTVRYKASHTDISFRVKDRIWINSDGRTNMPSGEVFTAPIEDSVNGEVHFTFPIIFKGQEVSGVTLQVEEGEVKSWDAVQGKNVLDEVFAISGARRFGEVAIGTNYGIQRITKNILFDEKIGGSIHMAVGQSYIQTGGKNQSDIHLDMITDMQTDGQIFADGKLIYERGKFLIF